MAAGSVDVHNLAVDLDGAGNAGVDQLALQINNSILFYHQRAVTDHDFQRVSGFDEKLFLIPLKVQLFSLRRAYTEPEPKEENPHG